MSEGEPAVVNRQRRRRIDAARLRTFLVRVVEAHPPRRPGEFTVCLVSDERMRRMNREFRGIDATTDVLSFPGEPPRHPEQRPQLGDVAISVPAAARQARSAGHSLERELCLLALHGYLHLLGHDHTRDGGRMLRLQRRLARRLLRPPSRSIGRGAG